VHAGSARDNGQHFPPHTTAAAALLSLIEAPMD
jgi:hypothetical protein